MGRMILLATMIFILGFSSSPAFSEQLAARPKGEGEWELYDKPGNLAGTVKKTEQGNFKFYNRGGKYVGLILDSGTWLPRDARRSYTIITPEDAELYLDVLKVLTNPPFSAVSVPLSKPGTQYGSTP
jgi:hypothetical protein